MAQLIRLAPSTTVVGIGYVRQGVIHTIPEHLAVDLLATGEWAELGAPERVTEPAPSTPAKKKKSGGR